MLPDVAADNVLIKGNTVRIRNSTRYCMVVVSHDKAHGYGDRNHCRSISPSEGKGVSDGKVPCKNRVRKPAIP